MTSMTRRPTEELRIVQRGAVSLLRPYAQFTTGVFRAIGERSYFLRDSLRAAGQGRTWGPELVKHMGSIGVDSVPLVCLVAAFIGSVIALQTRYQLFPGIQLSIVGLSSRQITILVDFGQTRLQRRA